MIRVGCPRPCEATGGLWESIYSDEHKADSGDDFKRSSPTARLRKQLERLRSSSGLRQSDDGDDDDL